MTEIKHCIICLDSVVFPNWFLCLMQFHSKFEHFLVLCGNWETNSKMYMVMKSTHNNKDNTKEQEEGVFILPGI